MIFINLYFLAQLYLYFNNNDPIACNLKHIKNVFLIDLYIHLISFEQLIKMGSSASTTYPSSENKQTVYPSLDTSGTSSNLPFSSPSFNQNLNVSKLGRNVSPIDNLPFTLSSNYTSNGATIDEDNDVTEILNRVQNFVNNAWVSDYNFKLENTIIREHTS